MRLRLVKMVVQPVLVMDDGEQLHAVEASPIQVSAADWPKFSGTRWPELMAEQEATLDDK